MIIMGAGEHNRVDNNIIIYNLIQMSHIVLCIFQVEVWVLSVQCASSHTTLGPANPKFWDVDIAYVRNVSTS